MLTDFVKGEKPEAEEIEARIDAARSKLARQQIQIKEKKLPVLVILDGWGAAGKGSVLGRVIKELDPRFFRTETLAQPTQDEVRRPFLYRYFVRIPEAGKISFFDSSWMDETTKSYLLDEYSEKEYANHIRSIKRFERQLSDNGYLLVKLFFDISEKEQKKRLEALREDSSTKWRVEKFDRWQNKHYKTCRKVYDDYLENTNQFSAPWYIIDSKSRKWAELQMLEIMTRAIDTALTNSTRSVPILQNTFPLKTMPKLSAIDPNVRISDDEYRTRLKELQAELSDLHNRIYHKRMPVIIAYEGWDAAGKGGNIKRVTAALDPRGYEVMPIASPEPHEKARHYLWRFWNRLPKDGHITIFDRTWYGRVMVERLEGFCSENDWQRAYNEINEFEQELQDWGAVLIKFWVHIDKDTQLERFNARAADPEKQWKITDEDWRNREKWDLYEEAVDEMIAKTSTEYAPWHILESDDKHFARIKALEIITSEIKKRL